MKKIIKFIIICMMVLCLSTNVSTTVRAQNNHLYINVTEYEDEAIFQYCAIAYDSIIFSKDPECTGSITWRVTYYPDGTPTVYHTDNIAIPFDNTYDHVVIKYWGCDIDGKWCAFYPLSFENVPEPWDNDTAWISLGTTLTLSAPYSATLNYLWPDGSTDRYYTITGPENSGKVWIRMYNDCGSETDTIRAYYKAELQTVTVDPYTDHIVIAWEVNPYLATYIQFIQLYRDGYPIATVPYTDGEYTDENVYGSVTSRTYTCKSVSTEGYISPFGTQKPSMHMVYLVDMFSNIVMEVNDVSDKYPIVQYYICLWEDGNITHIDSVAVRSGHIVNPEKHPRFAITRDGILRYTAPESYFSQGGFLIVEADLGGSKRDGTSLLSNRGNETVGLYEESEASEIQVYPNPARNNLTVTGTEQGGIIILYDILGKEVLRRNTGKGMTHINMNLPSGSYVMNVRIPTNQNRDAVYTKKIVIEGK